jgi:hypothetical protein
MADPGPFMPHQLFGTHVLQDTPHLGTGALIEVYRLHDEVDGVPQTHS